MLKINIITIGKNMPEWINQGFNEYAKRFSSDLQLNLTEITNIKRFKNSDLKKIQQEEGQMMLKKINPQDFIIALDEHGIEYSTFELAQQIQHWRENWNNICFFIGGPEGLSTECLQKANIKFALSRLTFPHPLVRVIVAEQIYRAWTILNKHPYHR